MPYVDGTPAGTARRAEVQWLGNVLYAEDKSAARLARATSSELGRVFAYDDVTDAIKACFEHDADFIHEYVDRNHETICQSARDGRCWKRKRPPTSRAVERPDPLESVSAVVSVTSKTSIDGGNLANLGAQRRGARSFNGRTRAQTRRRGETGCI